MKQFSALLTPRGSSILLLHATVLQSRPTIGDAITLESQGFENGIFNQQGKKGQFVWESTTSGKTTGINAGLKSTPNPFTDDISLSFGLEYDANVHLSIIDLAGRTLIAADKQLESGKGTWEITTTGLPAGTYLCRLQMGKEVRLAKIVKL